VYDVGCRVQVLVGCRAGDRHRVTHLGASWAKISLGLVAGQKLVQLVQPERSPRF